MCLPQHSIQCVRSVSILFAGKAFNYGLERNKQYPLRFLVINLVHRLFAAVIRQGICAGERLRLCF